MQTKVQYVLYPLYYTNLSRLTNNKPALDLFLSMYSYTNTHICNLLSTKYASSDFGYEFKNGYKIKQVRLEYFGVEREFSGISVKFFIVVFKHTINL